MGITTSAQQLPKKVSNAGGGGDPDPPPPYPGLRHASHLTVIPQLVNGPPASVATGTAIIGDSQASVDAPSASFLAQPTSVASVMAYGAPTSVGGALSTPLPQTALPGQQFMTSGAANSVPHTAETKLQLLTQELENRMDNQSPGEYYGKSSKGKS